jgi:nucleoside-diphosphate-sugar epimerase
MKILMTGHLGFVGRAFQRYFAGAGHDIVGVDIKEGNDARDFFKVDDRRFDLVVHLAAIVGGRLTIEGNPISVATDLSIDAEMFNWAVRTGQPRVVYYSSSAAYPIHLQQPGRSHLLRESDIDLANIANPDFTYGWAKLTGEMLAEYAERQGVRTHVFRPFSGYGEDQDLDYPFPSFVRRVVNREDPFDVWGDGTQVRDFIHVDDVVAATMAAVEHDIPGPVNLGWGIPTSFNDLAETMFKVSGWWPSEGIRHHIDKPVGVHYRCCDNTKLLSFYEPKISLEDGIARALDGC